MVLPPHTLEQPLTRSSAGSAESAQEDSPRRRSTRLFSSTASQSSSVAAVGSALETSSSSQSVLPSQLAQAMEQFPKGMVIVSQGAPRAQAVVVGHLATTGGAPLIQVFQAGFFRPQTGDWNPPGLYERLVNKLPNQEQPPTTTFVTLENIRTHLARLHRYDVSLTRTDVEPLITHLESLCCPLLTSSSLPPPYQPTASSSLDISFPHQQLSSSHKPPLPSFAAAPTTPPLPLTPSLLPGTYTPAGPHATTTDTLLYSTASPPLAAHTLQ